MIPLLLTALAGCAGQLHADPEGDSDAAADPVDTEVYVPETGETGTDGPPIVDDPSDGVDPRQVDPDACPTFIVPLTPRDGATDVWRRIPFVVGFREIEGERWAQVTLHQGGTKVALGVPTWTDDHQQVTVLPEDALDPSTPYVLRITIPCWTDTWTTEVAFTTER